MATTLLEDLKAHITATATAALPGLVFRIHNFSDADLLGHAPVLLLRRSGSGGDDDEIEQETDVDITVLVGGSQLKTGEDACQALRLFLKSDDGYSGPGAFAYVVYSPIVGPAQLTNGKHRFMFMVRCFTEDQ